MRTSPAARAMLVVIIVAPLTFGPAAAADESRLQAKHWSGRCPEADRTLLDEAGIADLNRHLLAVDRSLRDMATIPDSLSQADVASAIATLARLPDTPLIDAAGATTDAADRDRWISACRLDAIPARVQPRFAVVTRRAALRKLPTAERIRRAGGPADIDLFQESAFFPGTPVAAVHATADDRWTFVLGTTYSAWIETEALAWADRDVALDFARRSDLVVTATSARATPVAAKTAAVVLDMGTALPAARSTAPADGRVVELPLRTATGTLGLAPARIDPADAVRAGPLPASRRHVLEQAFRFLGEPYGWGHDHGARDCSGFVSEVYRSLGILLPRNTRDQAASPAFVRTVVEPAWSRDRRLAAIGGLLPGDLVYAPRHVMMIVGHDEAGPWVIHDTHSGRLVEEPATAHGVVVAPLRRILTEEGGLIVDSVTVLVRILPSADERP